MKRFLRRHGYKLYFGGITALFVYSLWPFLLFSGVLGFDSLREYTRRIPFDSAKWQDRSLIRSSDPIRIRMIDSLLDNYDFKGMDRAELVSLLGESDETEYFKSWDYVYYIGPERNPYSGVDSKWLVFRMNGGQTVTEYRLIED